MTAARPAAVVVLAAGEGTRMRSATPKVLHTLCGRTMLGHVLAAVAPLTPEHTLVVVGHGRDQVTAALDGGHARPVVQAEQRGTGHAVRVALQEVPEAHGTVVVVPGDAPMLTAEMLAELVAEHQRVGAAVTLLTSRQDDPTGYGRVIRDDQTGQVVRVVEHLDASDQERQIHEVATSVYAFDSELLRAALNRLSAENAKGEEYLTDVVADLVDGGRPVVAVRAELAQIVGVNDRVQLAAARRALNSRLLERWMRDGVTVVDPASTWVDADVRLDQDVTVHPNTQLCGSTRISRGAEVGPDCTITDTVVGEGARVVRAQCEGAEIGSGVRVGPFAYLRPGTRLAHDAKVGTFVEVKASQVGAGTKVPHLTYVGDATIGEYTNIGASSVFVNYDGEHKHRTVIGSHARTGADNMFVAPVSVGDGAYTGAGTVVRSNVPPGALAVSNGPQRNITGWVARRRPGSAAARAAEAAEGADTAEAAGQGDHAEHDSGHGEVT